jgi:hypothetical protein
VRTVNLLERQIFGYVEFTGTGVLVLRVLFSSKSPVHRAVIMDRGVGCRPVGWPIVWVTGI